MKITIVLKDGRKQDFNFSDDCGIVDFFWWPKVENPGLISWSYEDHEITPSNWNIDATKMVKFEKKEDGLFYEV